MASNSNPNYEPAKWSKKEVDTYVKLMVDEVKKGNKTTTTFNKAGWNAIKTQLEASTGRAFKMLQLRNKMNKLRMDYRRFKKLLETPGFDWNAVTRTCTAKDEGVWDRHIKLWQVIIELHMIHLVRRKKNIGLNLCKRIMPNHFFEWMNIRAQS